MLHDGAEGSRRYGEVIGWALGRTELPTQRLEGCGIVVVATDELQQPGKLFKSRGIQSSVFFQAVLRPLLNPVQAPGFPRYADNRDVKRAALYHRLQRRENFLVGQITGGAEKHQRVSTSTVFGHKYQELFFPGDRRIQSAWRREVCPGNWLRRGR